MLEKPKLFLTVKEFWFSMAVLTLLVVARLLFLYHEYRTFIQKPFYYTEVEVLQQYTKTKKGRTYTILRVHSQALGLYFFTRTYTQAPLLDKEVRLKLFPNADISFPAYLSTAYISSEINAVRKKPITFKSTLLNAIATQHTNAMIQTFYQAIFLAHPLSKELRQSISTLGISHLIALSGFHLAILSGVLFFLLKPLYRFFQQRYFPYRFDLIDIGLMVLMVLGWYVWFVEAPDSLVRSYMMMGVGWLLLITGMELLSFAFLSTIVMVLLVLNPKMLFSLAFWFSVLGVFYIFLLLSYFTTANKWRTTLIISFGIFVLMLPIIHIFFPLTSIAQLYSPLLSLGFTLFYPLSILLHLVGLGGILDDLLIQLLTHHTKTLDINLPMIYGIGYLLLSLWAIYSRWIFYLLLIMACGLMGGMFIRFML